MSISASFVDIVEKQMAGIVQLSADQLAQLAAHYELLLKWNQRMNLTTVTALPEAAVRHYCESLFLGKYLTPGLVADIGSGAGFPGVPCAILRPDCQFELVESNQRKAVFLKEASRGLKNVRVRAERAEALAGPYDWVTARAVDPGEVLRLKSSAKFALLLALEDAKQLIESELIPLPWNALSVLAMVRRPASM
jgi:16S rRNA (guanine527-N7)-methyltransferase